MPRNCPFPVVNNPFSLWTNPKAMTPKRPQKRCVQVAWRGSSSWKRLSSKLARRQIAPPTKPIMMAEWISILPEAPATEAIPAIMLADMVSTLQTQLVCSYVRQWPQIRGLSRRTETTLPATELNLSIIESKPISINLAACGRYMSEVSPSI